MRILALLGVDPQSRVTYTEDHRLTTQTAKRPNHQNNTITSTRDNSTTMSSIEAALAALESLEPGKQFSYCQIAEEYGCNYTTLGQRHQGISTSHATRYKNQQALHPQQEAELLLYIERLTRQGLPPTRAMIHNFASQVAKRELGVNWVDCFVQKYPDKLISKWTMGMDNSRHKADSGSKYSLYFDLLRDKIDQYQVEAYHIYNIDEKGFMLGIVGCSKRIFSKALYKARKRRSTIQDGS
jgi:hypothetical protein